jgi:hypothetical protein
MMLLGLAGKARRKPDRGDGKEHQGPCQLQKPDDRKVY